MGGPLGSSGIDAVALCSLAHILLQRTTNLSSGLWNSRGDSHVAIQRWPRLPLALLHVHLVATLAWPPLDALVGAQLGLPEDVHAWRSRDPHRSYEDFYRYIML